MAAGAGAGTTTTAAAAKTTKLSEQDVVEVLKMRKLEYERTMSQNSMK